MEQFHFSMGGYSGVIRLRKQRELLSQSCSRHCHAEYEVHIALLGRCAMDVDTKLRFLSAGEAMVIPPGQYHFPVSVDEENDRFFFSFSMEDGDAASEFARRAYPFTQVKLTPFALSLCARIRDEWNGKKPFGRSVLQSLGIVLLSEVFRGIFYAGDVGGQGETGEKQPRLMAIDHFFENNLSGESTEQDLAKQLNLSRRQLARVLLAQYGMSYREKLRHSRMDRAGWLLRTTDMPVSAVSEAVGYLSDTSFFKAFKQHFGTTPLAYRKNIRESGQPKHEENAL